MSRERFRRMLDDGLPPPVQLPFIPIELKPGEFTLKTGMVMRGWLPRRVCVELPEGVDTVQIWGPNGPVFPEPMPAMVISPYAFGVSVPLPTLKPGQDLCVTGWWNPPAGTRWNPMAGYWSRLAGHFWPLLGGYVRVIAV